MSDYNGWKNHATCNVALWLMNDESLYNMVMSLDKEVTYRDFATNYLVYTSAGTPDGVAWLDEALDYEALDEVLQEQ